MDSIVGQHGELVGLDRGRPWLFFAVRRDLEQADIGDALEVRYVTKRFGDVILIGARSERPSIVCLAAQFGVEDGVQRFLDVAIEIEEVGRDSVRIKFCGTG